jgi:hypothetical protein
MAAANRRGSMASLASTSFGGNPNRRASAGSASAASTVASTFVREYPG